MRSLRTTYALTTALTCALALAACGDDGDDGGGGADSGAETVNITLAHSYTEDQPQHVCGAQVIKDETEAADVGLTIEIFPASQLGGDADRVASVQSGDIDIDIQGASALAAVYDPIGIVDATYAFEDAAQMKEFFSSDAAEQLRTAFKDASGIDVLGAWSAGSRHFTANVPIRTPEDLDGLRMRFPGSPQFLLNAQALGAKATEVAYEELYLALQQGVVDGQENPLTNIDASNLVEVQDVVSMSAHQQNSNLIIIGGVWETLSEEQQAALTDATNAAVDQMAGCVDEAEQEILDKWAAEDAIEVVEDVDREAFAAKTDEWFRANLTGDTLEMYTSIKDSQS